MDTNDYLNNVLLEFKQLKNKAEKGMVQIDEHSFFKTLDSESNSIALIVKHMAGNMHSRWTDFLTSDGEKPSRKRDQEFELNNENNRYQLMKYWNSGWNICFETINNLNPSDLNRRITIRNQPHTVYQAINRQLTHYGEHVGQIIFIAKHLRYAKWQTLSIPRGESENFLKKMESKFKK